MACRETDFQAVQRENAIGTEVTYKVEQRVVVEERGLQLEATTIDMLGNTEKIVVDKDNTTIVNGSGNKNDIKSRVSQIKAQIETTTSDYDYM